MTISVHSSFILQYEQFWLKQKCLKAWRFLATFQSKYWSSADKFTQLQHGSLFLENDKGTHMNDDVNEDFVIKADVNMQPNDPP